MFILIKSCGRECPECYAFIKTRFINMRCSQLLLCPRPKENVGFCLLCFASTPVLLEGSVFASLDDGVRIKRMDRERLKRCEKRRDDYFYFRPFS